MESLELANQIVEIVVDRLAEDVLILDITEVTTFTDYFVICTGNSRRQLDALQAAIREELKQIEEVALPISIEGDPDGGWILLDYNSVIVHLFSPETRAYYQLEDLWKNGRVVARIQ
ncbi:MAG: ribosome silencing factor [Anaerolineae bacterium]|nr:ribosome silencing factor [Anaerolineae bacterium]